MDRINDDPDVLLPPEVADDYSENMFREGRNQAERHPLVADAPAYTDDSPDEDLPAVLMQPLPPDAFDRLADASEEMNDLPEGEVPFLTSRDGTEAAGLYDESGGPLGGSEEEIDAMEIAGTPVDKNPRMKD